VGETNFLHQIGLDLVEQRKRQVTLENALDTAFIIASGGSSANITNDQAKDYYNVLVDEAQRTGSAVDAGMAYDIARSINHDGIPLKDTIERMVTSGSPEEIQQASALIARDSADKKSKVLVGLDKDAKLVARLFTNYSYNQELTPQQVADKARSEVFDISDKTAEEREKQFANIIQKRGYSDSFRVQKKVSNLLDSSTKAIPLDMVSDFRVHLKQNYKNCGNELIAEAQTKEDLLRMYSLTRTNGPAEWTKGAPEDVIPKPFVEVQNEKALDLMSLIPKTKKAYDDKNGFDYYLELPEGEIITPEEWSKQLHPSFSTMGEIELLGQPVKRKFNIKEDLLQKFDDITIYKVTKDGFGYLHKEKCWFKIIADNLTEFPAQGQQPSYLAVIVPESTGRPELIINPDDTADVIRFTPTVDPGQDLQSKLNKFKSKYRRGMRDYYINQFVEYQRLLTGMREGFETQGADIARLLWGDENPFHPRTTDVKDD